MKFQNKISLPQDQSYIKKRIIFQRSCSLPLRKAIILLVEILASNKIALSCNSL